MSTPIRPTPTRSGKQHAVLEDSDSDDGKDGAASAAARATFDIVVLAHAGGSPTVHLGVVAGGRTCGSVKAALHRRLESEGHFAGAAAGLALYVQGGRGAELAEAAVLDWQVTYEALRR